MGCPHGRPRGRCRICRMEELEDFYGVPEDHIDDEDEEDEERRLATDGGRPRANLSCVQCGGEYAETDEPLVFECQRCGHKIDQRGFVEETADRLREYDDMDDVADWLDEQAEKLEEVAPDV